VASDIGSLDLLIVSRVMYKFLTELLNTTTAIGHYSRETRMQLPDWFDLFNTVCACRLSPLQWGLPESWVHAELYAELKRRAHSSRWMPFSTEIPYVTFYPVGLPRKGNRRSLILTVAPSRQIPNLD